MSKSRITFRLLKTFTAVERLHNFTRATAEFLPTHPSVQIQIGQLADTICLPAFERNGRKFVLTSAGKELQPALWLECRRRT